MRSTVAYIIMIALLTTVESSCAGDITDASDQQMDVALPDAEAPPQQDATESACRGHWITRATGSVVDEAGGSIVDARPQLCLRIHETGQQLCLAPPFTDEGGQFDIEVPDGRCVEELAMRISLPSSLFGTSYCQVELAPVEGLLAFDPFVLFSVREPSVLPPLGDDAEARTVVFEDGLEMDVVPADLGIGGDYSRLAARRIEIDAPNPCFAETLDDLEGIYLLSKESNAEPGFPIRIPNSTGLPASSGVELLLVGGLSTYLPDDTYVQEAELAPFGTGTVTDDGSMIVSDPGSELPYLSWLAYRAIR